MRGEPVSTGNDVGKLALRMERTLDGGKRRFPWMTAGIVAAVLAGVYFFVRK